jgi:hypothetical protein
VPEDGLEHSAQMPIETACDHPVSDCVRLKEAAMKTPTAPSTILTRWLRRPAPNADDAADYGTAFGLELSLQPMPTPPAEPSPAVASGRRRPRWALWPRR